MHYFLLILNIAYNTSTQYPYSFFDCHKIILAYVNAEIALQFTDFKNYLQYQYSISLFFIWLSYHHTVIRRNCIIVYWYSTLLTIQALNIISHFLIVIPCQIRFWKTFLYWLQCIFTLLCDSLYARSFGNVRWLYNIQFLLSLVTFIYFLRKNYSL